jgi:DnaJ homolog subfamily C member 17
MFRRMEIKSGSTQDGVKINKNKILKVSWDGSPECYTATKLKELFQKFGEVEYTVIKTRKSRSKGSAIVVMGSKEAAVSPDSILLFLYYFALYYYFPFNF